MPRGAAGQPVNDRGWPLLRLPPMWFSVGCVIFVQIARRECRLSHPQLPCRLSPTISRIHARCFQARQHAHPKAHRMHAIGHAHALSVGTHTVLTYVRCATKCMNTRVWGRAGLNPAQLPVQDGYSAAHTSRIIPGRIFLCPRRFVGHVGPAAPARSRACTKRARDGASHTGFKHR